MHLERMPERAGVDALVAFIDTVMRTAVERDQESTDDFPRVIHVSGADGVLSAHLVAPAPSAFDWPAADLDAAMEALRVALRRAVDVASQRRPSPTWVEDPGLVWQGTIAIYAAGGRGGTPLLRRWMPPVLMGAIVLGALVLVLALRPAARGRGAAAFGPADAPRASAGAR